MFRKAGLLVCTFITSAVMAMDGEEMPDTVETIGIAQHILVPLNPDEGSHIECEDLAPLPQPLTVFLSKILDAAMPGTYADTLGQMWNVSEHDSFVRFVGNRHDYALSSVPVRPEGVYTYPEMGMISVIYDFLKDGEQFFSLELTRIPEEYRVARVQENAEYRAMRDAQDREHQESLERDRECQAQQIELVKMGEEDAYSRLSINAPPPPYSIPPLTRKQLRDLNAASFAQKFAQGKLSTS